MPKPTTHEMIEKAVGLSIESGHKEALSSVAYRMMEEQGTLPPRVRPERFPDYLQEEMKVNFNDPNDPAFKKLVTEVSQYRQARSPTPHEMIEKAVGLSIESGHKEALSSVAYRMMEEQGTLPPGIRPERFPDYLQEEMKVNFNDPNDPAFKKLVAEVSQYRQARQATVTPPIKNAQPQQQQPPLSAAPEKPLVGWKLVKRSSDGQTVSRLKVDITDRRATELVNDLESHGIKLNSVQKNGQWNVEVRPDSMDRFSQALYRADEQGISISEYLRQQKPSIAARQQSSEFPLNTNDSQDTEIRDESQRQQPRQPSVLTTPEEALVGWKLVKRSSDNQTVDRLKVDITDKRTVNLVEELESHGIRVNSIRKQGQWFLEVQPESMSRFDKWMDQRQEQQSQQQQHKYAPPKEEIERQKAQRDAQRAAETERAAKPEPKKGSSPMTPEEKQVRLDELKNRPMSPERAAAQKAQRDANPEWFDENNKPRKEPRPLTREEADAREDLQAQRDASANAKRRFDSMNPQERLDEFDRIREKARTNEPITQEESAFRSEARERYLAKIATQGAVAPNAPENNARPTSEPPVGERPIGTGVSGVKGAAIDTGLGAGANLGLGAYGMYESAKAGDKVGFGLATANTAVGATETAARVAALRGATGALADGVGVAGKVASKAAIPLVIAQATYDAYKEEGTGADDKWKYKAERVGSVTLTVGAAVGTGAALAAAGVAGAVLAPAVAAVAVGHYVTETINTDKIYAAEDKKFAETQDLRNLTGVYRAFTNGETAAENEAVKKDYASRGAKFDEYGNFDLNDAKTRNALHEEIEKKKEGFRQTMNQNDSIVPRAMRWGNSVNKYNEAKYNLDVYNAATAELDNYGKNRDVMLAKRAERVGFEKQADAETAKIQPVLEMLEKRKNKDGGIDLSSYAQPSENGPVFNRDSMKELNKDIAALEEVTKDGKNQQLVPVRDGLKNMAELADKDLTKREKEIAGQQQTAAPAAGAAASRAGATGAPQQPGQEETPILSFLKKLFEGAFAGITQLFNALGGLFKGGQHNEQGAGQDSAQARQQQTRAQQMSAEVTNDLKSGKFDKAADVVEELAKQQDAQAEKVKNVTVAAVLETRAEINHTAAEKLRNDPDHVVEKLLDTKVGEKKLGDMLNGSKQEQKLADQYIIDKLGGAKQYAAIDEKLILKAQAAAHPDVKNKLPVAYAGSNGVAPAGGSNVVANTRGASAQGAHDHT